MLHLANSWVSSSKSEYPPYFSIGTVSPEIEKARASARVQCVGVGDRGLDMRSSNYESNLQSALTFAYARIVAHDLKTPLGMMLGYTGLLEEEYERYNG